MNPHADIGSLGIAGTDKIVPGIVEDIQLRRCSFRHLTIRLVIAPIEFKKFKTPRRGLHEFDAFDLTALHPDHQEAFFLLLAEVEPSRRSAVMDLPRKALALVDVAECLVIGVSQVEVGRGEFQILAGRDGAAGELRPHDHAVGHHDARHGFGQLRVDFADGSQRVVKRLCGHQVRGGDRLAPQGCDHMAFVR